MNLPWQITFLILILTGFNLKAQFFPELEGANLEEAIVAEFKPNFVEMYTPARVILYGDIYNINDTVHTLYSGHTLYLPPTEEYPIQFLAMDARPDGINAEHIYPRSKGARPENGNAFSDMHNLAPSRWEVNEARSNFAFAEVLDTDTDRWYYKDMVLNNANSLSNEEIKLYSEVDDLGDNFGFFEPREAVKGDVARSVFYFYTMYRDEAMSADPNFFDDMKEDLCTWHMDDPVDELESYRNDRKALYQDNKVNPFIADCSLANRLYCPDNPPNCKDFSTSTEEIVLNINEDEFDPKIKILPNPNNGIFKLDISNIKPGIFSLLIFDISGKKLYDITEELDYFNTINMWNVQDGLYILHLINHHSGRKYSNTFEVIK